MLRILHDTKYDFIKHWKTAVIATIAFIVVGIGLMKSSVNCHTRASSTSATLRACRMARRVPTPCGATAVRSQDFCVIKG